MLDPTTLNPSLNPNYFILSGIRVKASNIGHLTFLKKKGTRDTKTIIIGFDIPSAIFFFTGNAKKIA